MGVTFIDNKKPKTKNELTIVKEKSKRGLLSWLTKSLFKKRSLKTPMNELITYLITKANQGYNFVSLNIFHGTEYTSDTPDLIYIFSVYEQFPTPSKIGEYRTADSDDIINNFVNSKLIKEASIWVDLNNFTNDFNKLCCIPREYNDIIFSVLYDTNINIQPITIYNLIYNLRKKRDSVSTPKDKGDLYNLCEKLLAKGCNFIGTEYHSDFSNRDIKSLEPIYNTVFSAYAFKKYPIEIYKNKKDVKRPNANELIDSYAILVTDDGTIVNSSQSYGEHSYCPKMQYGYLYKTFMLDETGKEKLSDSILSELFRYAPSLKVSSEKADHCINIYELLFNIYEDKENYIKKRSYTSSNYFKPNASADSIITNEELLTHLKRSCLNVPGKENVKALLSEFPDPYKISEVFGITLDRVKTEYMNEYPNYVTLLRETDQWFRNYSYEMKRYGIENDISIDTKLGDPFYYINTRWWAYYFYGDKYSYGTKEYVKEFIKKHDELIDKDNNPTYKEYNKMHKKTIESSQEISN